MALKPCLTCGTPSDSSRCPKHRTRAPSKPGSTYNRQHKRLKDMAVTRHVLQYGWICPGYECDPHPVPPGGLVGDHHLPHSKYPELAYEPSNYRALCSVCNSRKGNR
jgi:5-methylcytosine-specific restriction enzyme A